MKRQRYTIIDIDPWFNPASDKEDFLSGEAHETHFGIYDLITETLAQLDGRYCMYVHKGDALAALARLEGCP